MLNQSLLDKLARVEQLASTSKWGRMWANPIRYGYAILFRELFYKRTRRERELVCPTFFGAPMHVLLPSSTDIFLTGGKSHPSEIRLAKYLMRNLAPGEVFMDIGAHYGYFSLLAAHLVGPGGRVIAFEASPTTYRVLEKNSRGADHIAAHHLAVSDSGGEVSFYEFPNLYAEYNTLDVAQFQGERWFAKAKPREVRVPAVPLDEFLNGTPHRPHLLKIDVEGAEYKVLSGATALLRLHHPTIVMEYLSDGRGNEVHRQAEGLLRSLGFRAYRITPTGAVEALGDIRAYLHDNGLESDNILFRKG